MRQGMELSLWKKALHDDIMVFNDVSPLLATVENNVWIVTRDGGNV